MFDGRDQTQAVGRVRIARASCLCLYLQSTHASPSTKWPNPNSQKKAPTEVGAFF
jgi:hypothetical protein